MSYLILHNECPIDLGDFGRLDIFRDGIRYRSARGTASFVGRNAFLLAPPMIAARSRVTLPPFPCRLPACVAKNSHLSVDLDSANWFPDRDISSPSLTPLGFPLAFPMPKYFRPAFLVEGSGFAAIFPKRSYVAFLKAEEPGTLHLMFERGSFEVRLTDFANEEIIEGLTRFENLIAHRFPDPELRTFQLHEHNVFSVFTDSQCLVASMPTALAARIRPSDIASSECQLSRFGGELISSIKEISPANVYTGNFSKARRQCQGRGLEAIREVVRLSAAKGVSGIGLD